MFLSPLWPPALPLRRMRVWPTSREMSHPLDGDFIKAHGLADSLSRQVHESVGLHEEDLFSLDDGGAAQGFEFEPGELAGVFARQAVHSVKAYIVAGVFIVLSRIAQAHHQVFHRGGGGWL